MARRLANPLLRITRVAEEATRIFGSEEKAERWLRTPSPALGDAAPWTLLGSGAGAESVLDELVRIDHGDFA